MTRLLMVFLAAVCTVGPAMAQTIDCSKAETQLEMTACAQRDWQTADIDLNQAYRVAQSMMKAIDANGVVGAKRGAAESLRAAERAWIAYRDAVCLSESFAWQGGSGELMAIYACRARITKARTADLWSMTLPR